MPLAKMECTNDDSVRYLFFLCCMNNDVKPFCMHRKMVIPSVEQIINDVIYVNVYIYALYSIYELYFAENSLVFLRILSVIF